IAAGVSAASGVYGLIKSASANKKNKALVTKQQGLLDQQYLPDMNKRYLDTEQGASFLSTMRDKLKENNQQALDRSAITGGTDESALAARDNNVRTYGDYLNKLQGYGTQYTQGLKDRYMQGASALMGTSMGQNSADSQSGSNLFSNSMSSIGNIAMKSMFDKGMGTSGISLNNTPMIGRDTLVNTKLKGMLNTPTSNTLMPRLG
ncbi:MAG: hypothetical protein ABFD50_17605, partial [Smithella sp.]